MSLPKQLQVLLFFLFFVPLTSSAQFSDELKVVAKMMQGKFSSEKQSKEDTSYFDIRLNITPIWKERNDAIWLYVEQAVSSKIEKPYRQRVYKLTQMIDGSFESAVYTMKDPIRFAGKAELLINLNPDSLELREGCSVFFRKVGKKLYEGGTHEKTCPSDMRGAAYASSIVTISSKMLLSWDRGFDRSDKQVWGAENGGYRFLRVRK